jgi:DNA-binding response OmpR family regulator
MLRKSTKLQPQEQELLDALTERRGRFVSHEDLVDRLWGDDEDGGPCTANNVIRQRVWGIRRKMPSLKIESRIKYGYRIAC